MPCRLSCSSLSSSSRIERMSSLPAPLMTSVKRCTVNGPSATNSRLSSIDFTSSRSMLLFLGFLSICQLRRLFHGGGSFDNDRSGQLFLEDSYRAHFHQLQHPEKRHHHIHARLGLIEQFLKQNPPMGAQLIQEQSHLLAHRNFIEFHLVEDILRQTIDDSP